MFRTLGESSHYKNDFKTINGTLLKCSLFFLSFSSFFFSFFMFFNLNPKLLRRRPPLLSHCSKNVQFTRELSDWICCDSTFLVDEKINRFPMLACNYYATARQSVSKFANVDNIKSM